MAPHAAPSRDMPTAAADLEAGTSLRLGEYATESTLNISEARVVLQKALDARIRAATGAGGGSNNHPSGPTGVEDNEIVIKMKDYLEIFATFKDLAEAQQVEGIVNSYCPNLHMFEKSQLGSLVPTCADEAKALIPSLEKKVEDNLVSDDDLEGICRELQKLKRQAQL